jgi:hypothetical protein
MCRARIPEQGDFTIDRNAVRQMKIAEALPASAGHYLMTCE